MAARDARWSGIRAARRCSASQADTAPPASANASSTMCWHRKPADGGPCGCARCERHGSVQLGGLSQVHQRVGDIGVPGGDVELGQRVGRLGQRKAQRPVGVGDVGQVARGRRHADSHRVERPVIRGMMPVDDAVQHQRLTGVEGIGVEVGGSAEAERIAGTGQRSADLGDAVLAQLSEQQGGREARPVVAEQHELDVRLLTHHAGDDGVGAFSARPAMRSASTMCERHAGRRTRPNRTAVQ